MGSTIEEAEAYLKKALAVQNQLSAKTDLYSTDKLDEFKYITSTLRKNIDITKEENRNLRIGIIGAVKAGKSSFLNACIFNGEDFLPKAATPMTAALTILTYAEKPSATVHFYLKDDWRAIENRAKEYDEKLEKDYEEYKQEYNNRLNEMDRMDRAGLSYNVATINSLLDKKEYELQYFRRKVSEYQLASKELADQAKGLSILDKLDSSIELEGDIIQQLDDYIGADGTYTPIVNYVELRLNNDDLEGLEIIDTPGLNDPVVSRGLETKQYLGECDAVLLLSPCSQFMDEETIRLVANSLPSAGVQEVVVIGSKLDSGILNDKGGDFEQKWAYSLQEYQKQLDKNIKQIKVDGRNKKVLSKLESGKALFISSICFDIYMKLKEGLPLNDEEEHILNQFKNNYDNFDERYLYALSGIGDVSKRLDEIADRKKEIIDSKNADLLQTASTELLNILEEINIESISSHEKLENSSVEELMHRSAEISRVINNTRSKLMSMFNNAALDCERKSGDIKTIIVFKKDELEEFKTRKEITTEQMTVNTGIFGIVKKSANKEVINYYANTDQVKDSCQRYASKCLETINKDFQSLFDEQEFSRQVKEIILKAFESSDIEFDPDEILDPLSTILKELEIPRIEFDVNNYFDRINAGFASGYAKNADIYKLSSLREDCLSEITFELDEKLDQRVHKIQETLKKDAATFADRIEKKLCGEVDRIQHQMAEKQKYITKYQQFATEIKMMKEELYV